MTFKEIGIENFFNYLPQLRALTMRPHAKEFFYNGISLNEFPPFENLDTLHLDSINLGKIIFFIQKGKKKLILKCHGTLIFGC